MADFSFLSDSDDEKAVQELLSQAMDQTVLEQVAKINCSGFGDSVLPTHLETQFQKLKSFPSAESKPKCSSTHRHSASSSMFKNSNKNKIESMSVSDEEDADDDKGKIGFSLNLEKNSVEKLGIKGSSKSGVNTRGSKSSSFSGKDEISSHSKKIPDGEKGLEKNLESVFHLSPESEKLSSSKKAPDDSKVGKLKFTVGKMGLEVKSPSGSSSNSLDSTLESLSPPPRSSCFWCSPKRVPRKKSKENGILNTSLHWEKNDEILSDFSNFLAKDQQKLLKKAKEEEEKISREAEKIVKWAKQASARMAVSGVEDELSDSESFK